MDFRINAGWLQPASKIPSTNFDARPEGCEIDLLVIHNISLPPGEFGGGFVEQLFCNTLDCNKHPYFDRLRGLKVSSHLLIDRNGDVSQFVAFHQRAWHAGESVFEGRSRCNDFSIGIELEGVDDQAYSNEQYASLIAVTQALFRHYGGLNPQRILGHSDIAPNRKTDPGPAFDWQRYKNALA